MGADNLNNWIIIYRGYSAEERACARARLQKWLDNPFDAQTQGSKSYERSRNAIVEQLTALQRVMNETSGASPVGIMDASPGIWGGQGIGIGLNGFPNSWN